MLISTSLTYEERFVGCDNGADPVKEEYDQEDEAVSTK